MTDKEQIIIDGTECKHYNNGSCQEGDYPAPLADIISCDPQNIRCDFYIDRIEEQLARKTQECEELKEKIKNWKCNYVMIAVKGPIIIFLAK